MRNLPYHIYGRYMRRCGGYLLILATVPRCRALHILIDAKSTIYILLINIFSPRVTLVTTVLWRVPLGTVLPAATVLRCRALHILIDAKSPIYILLLNTFSPRVTRVTLVPCPNTTQLAT